MTIAEIQQIVAAGGVVILDIKDWPRFRSQAAELLDSYEIHARVDPGSVKLARCWPYLYMDTWEGQWHRLAHGGPSATYLVDLG